LIGIVDDPGKIKLVKDEISTIKWVTLGQLVSEIDKSPEIFCPWMLVALYFLPESNDKVSERHKKILEVWSSGSSNNKKHLEKSLKYHFPNNTWGLKKE